jgi:signal transduction histidine kinase
MSAPQHEDDVTRLRSALAQERRRRERSEVELARTQNELRARDEFMTALSHELRTPLSVMLGWAQLLQKAANDGHVRNDALLHIERSAHAEASLIERLLDTSRVMQKKVQIANVGVDLADVVRDAIAGVTEVAAQRGVRLVPAVESGAEVRADPERLRRVIEGLLGHCIHASSPAAMVSVVLVVDTGKVVLAVACDSRVSRAAPSTLAVFVARQLAELHGGSLSVEGGSDIVLTLPRCSSERAAS